MILILTLNTSNFWRANPNNLTELVAKIVTKRKDHKEFIF